MNFFPTLFRTLPRAVRMVSWMFLVLATSGCKTAIGTDPVVGFAYQPGNVYRSFNQVPVSVRRVAILPTTCNARPTELESGRTMLEPVIAEELGKTKVFETITVTPEQLRSWTGRSAWRAEEAVPPELLKLIKEHLGCDAVLFSRLTQYRAYPPLAVGLSFKLVEITTAEFLWAADEIFDASEPGVVNGARRYQQTREQLPAVLADSRSILNSPSGFGRYAAASMFQTLPNR